MSQSNAIVVLKAFGNDYSAIQSDVILPQLLSRMDQRTPLLRTVHIDQDDVAMNRGDVLTIPKPQYIEDVRYQTSAPSVSEDLSVETVKCELSEHIYVEGQFGDREAAATMAGYVPDALAAMVDALSRKLNRSVVEKFKEISNVSGILDSQNERTKRDLINAREAMNKLKVHEDKTLALSGETAGEILGILTAGSDSKREVEGNIGRVFGFDPVEDNMVGVHEAGSASEDASIVTAISTAAGSPVLAISGASADATFKRGDILYVAGTKQTFAVAADVVADETGAASVYVTEGARTAIPAGAAVRVAGDHRQDTAYHQSAIVMAFRQLKPIADQKNATISMMSHPETGMPLRMATWYEPKTYMTHVKIDTLYGIVVAAPERALRMGGH